MRDLHEFELEFVTGAGCSPNAPTPPTSPPMTNSKNNNGYGNGAESGPAPGNSGSSNPQLITQNSGPRGDR